MKVVIGMAQERKFDMHYFIASGHMPSAHSSTVCALATAVGLTSGFASSAFAIAAIVAIIVMYDAAGVRRAVSHQSVILNRIMREFRENSPPDEIEKNVREFIGHTPMQVVVGAALGVAVAIVGVLLTRL
jgi:acid phosphatase family membrane protein YuiD